MRCWNPLRPLILRTQAEWELLQLGSIPLRTLQAKHKRQNLFLSFRKLVRVTANEVLLFHLFSAESNQERGDSRDR